MHIIGCKANEAPASHEAEVVADFVFQCGLSRLQRISAHVVYIAAEMIIGWASGLHTITELHLQQSETCGKRQRREEIIIVSPYRARGIGKVAEVESHMLIPQSHGQHACFLDRQTIFGKQGIVLLFHFREPA